MLYIAIFLLIVLYTSFLWLPFPERKKPPEDPRITRARAKYAKGDIELDDFEGRIARILSLPDDIHPE